MLKIIHRLGFGPRDAPTVPGMQVIEWQVVEYRNRKVVTALCHKDAALWVTCHDENSPPDTSQLTESSSVTDLETVLRLDSVELTNIYPVYDAQFALNCDTGIGAKQDVFVKQTQILNLIEDGMSEIQTSRPAEATAHEASICERLAQRAHPNIAEYLGVHVRDRLSFPYRDRKLDVPLTRNSVLGIVFKKYDCTLDELVIRRQKLDVKMCLQDIATGIQHLHGMGLVHGDVRPHHVYVKRGDRYGTRDQFVLGDFHAAHNKGSVVSFKMQAGQWSKRKKTGVDIAQEDDWFAFQKIVEWLVDETGVKLEDYKGIEKVLRKS